MCLPFFTSIFKDFKNSSIYCFVVAMLSLCCLVIISGFNVYVDPYWLFRRSPVWESSPGLDTKQRFYKPLQMAIRNPDVIFIGSSRVYRGIQPNTHFFQGDLYNAGISSLNIEEIYSILKSVTGQKTKKVVIGLDYWMFSSSAVPLQSLEKYGSTFDNLATALLSLDAYKDSREALKASKSNDYWMYNGFHHTSDKSETQVEDMYQSYIKSLDEKKISTEKLKTLENIVDLLKRRNVQVILYLSPLHPRTFCAYDSQKFESLVLELKKLAKASDVELLDFSHDYLESALPLNNSSNEDWLDYSHFSPKIGDEIQRKIQEHKRESK